MKLIIRNGINFCIILLLSEERHSMSSWFISALEKAAKVKKSKASNYLHSKFLIQKVQWIELLSEGAELA